MDKRVAAPATLVLLFIKLTVSSCVKYKADEETLALYTRAAGAYAEGRFTESAELLSPRKMNNFPPALVLKGKANFFSGNEGAAEMYLRRAVKLKPASAEASLYLARLCREKGESAEAAKITETLLSNNPHDLKTLRFAAGLEREKGPAGEAAAISYLDRAAETSFEIALVFLDRAKLRWKSGNGVSALEDLRRAESVLPEESPLRGPILNLASIIGNSLAAGDSTKDSAVIPDREIEKTGGKLP